MILRKPPVGGRMVDVVGPCQGEQDIDIQQGDGETGRRGETGTVTARLQELPRRLKILATGGRRDIIRAETRRSGRYLKDRETVAAANGVRAATPRRASSDRAAPTETRRATAKARAASRTSFSTSSVVRISIL